MNGAVGGGEENEEAREAGEDEDDDNDYNDYNDYYGEDEGGEDGELKGEEEERGVEEFRTPLRDRTLRHRAQPLMWEAEKDAAAASKDLEDVVVASDVRVGVLAGALGGPC